MAERQCSIVEYFAEHEGYRCGYCKSPNTNYSHGMWAHSMTVQDYQDLMDRGWRRSGKYCYKPTMNSTCCPQYTIRCDAVEFKLSKSQKTVLKRFNRYLNTGHVKQEGHQDAKNEVDAKCSDEPQDGCDSMMWKGENIDESKVALRDVPDISVKQIPVAVDNSCSGEQENIHQCDNSKTTLGKDLSANTSKDKKTTAASSGLGPDPLKPPCKKAKLLRKERRDQKRQMKELQDEVDTSNMQVNANRNSPSNQGKTLEEFLADVQETPVHRLEIRLVKSKPAGEDFLRTFAEEYAVYLKYQQVIHNDPPEKCTEKQYTRFLVDSPIEIRLVRSCPPTLEFKRTEESSYQIYQKYQLKVHEDPPEECDKESYLNFLVKSPLEHYCPPNGPELGYGSFHQQYWLDGKLIAVGVIDILPHSVSSVYFYYDPDYAFLSLGTYASLREISFTRELQRRVSHLKYYYMGFYIHSCVKMRYKGQYAPSFLLCPEAYTWNPIDLCRPKLEVSKYSRLEQDLKKGDRGTMDNIGDILILHAHEAMQYMIYRALKPEADDEAEVQQYASLVGSKCAKRMLLYRA